MALLAFSLYMTCRQDQPVKVEPHKALFLEFFRDIPVHLLLTFLLLAFVA